MKKKNGSAAAGIVLFVLCAALCAGVKLAFHACGQTEEGKWMGCHLAEQAVFAVGISLTAAALMLLIVKNADVKRGLALSMIPQAAVTAIIPNTLIKLCMKTDMRCHAVTKHAVIILSVMIAVCALICAVMNRESDRK